MDFFEKDPRSPQSGDSPRRSDIAPLADRLRPETLDEFVGQEKVVGPNTPLRLAIENDRVGSIIFWGPPGSGKTTLARLIARQSAGQWMPFSAVTSGIKEVKEVLSKAGRYYEMSGRRTYVFVDEIHRFNKAQQDAFLPYVESGDIILIGATTENPSFEVISALLSRMRVYVLERLSPEHIKVLIQRALDTPERGLGHLGLSVSPDGMEFLAAAADGDARRGLTLLETTAQYVGDRKEITVDDLRQVHQKGMLQYDKAGEEHYNIISAWHKSLRGGDPDASLYWLARMLDAGEDPLFIARRLIRASVEDVGLADPYALTLAMSARDAYHFLGSPEGELALAQCTIYLTCAAKSNSVYLAYGRATKDAAEKGSLPVPMSIRNAPTALMKALGYGAGYQYAHDYEDAVTGEEYLPDKLAGIEYYQPTEHGREAKLAEYLQKYRAYRRRLKEQREDSETGR